jgi:D-3-phosphoglycerate dehydrogenase
MPAAQLASEFEAQGYVGGKIVHQWTFSTNEGLLQANRYHELHGPTGFTDQEELSAKLAPVREQVIGIVTQFFPVSRELIEALPALSFIGTVRNGTQNLDVAAASEAGVAVYNNPGRNAAVVADYTVALMLASCRGVAVAHRALMDGEWLARSARTAFRTLSSTPVGLVGFGQVGQLVARLLRGFECVVRVYDPYLRPDITGSHGARQVETLSELLKRSELVSLHARVTAESTGLIGAEELALLGADGILVNTARAELVDEHALVEALKSGRLGAAALDVYSEEPLPPGHALREFANVTLTPHLAGGSRDALVTAVRRLANRLRTVTPSPLWTTFVTTPVDADVEAGEVGEGSVATRDENCANGQGEPKGD